MIHAGTYLLVVLCIVFFHLANVVNIALCHMGCLKFSPQVNLRSGSPCVFPQEDAGP